MVRFRVMQGKRQTAPKQILIQPHKARSHHVAELMHEPSKVSRGIEFLAQPGFFQRLLIAR